ncbi:MAG: hypothetical protein HQK75_20385 [Candidatus Magnetomorum sp.]|nr:hypothetical protein [Candidatus Magnetomorum sp.]
MILRLIILWAIVYFGYRAIKSIMFDSIAHQQRESLHRNQGHQTPVIDTMIEDPECGVYFPKKNGVRAKINGNDILFCSNDCKKKYIEKMNTHINQ